MPNIIFSLTLAVSSFIFFIYSYRINSINRAMLNIPLSIFESSIPLVQDAEDPTIYFDKDLLHDKITYYLDSSINDLCVSYQLDFYYYNQIDESICKTDLCDAVEIDLKAEIFQFVNYNRRVRFYIQDNKL